MQIMIHRGANQIRGNCIEVSSSKARIINISYEIIYLLGLLSEIYLNNNQLAIAEKPFNIGMTVIKRGKEKNMDEGSYDKDIDSFLDLKIKMDKVHKNDE